ncbi:Adenylosuccinate lyase [Plasmodiophora brassicae]
MATSTAAYENPLVSRYASAEMTRAWSAQVKFSTWRRLWLCLAETQRELGIDQVTAQALDEMRQTLDDVNFDVAAEIERNVRHDVMAHVKAWGLQCPTAVKIIHLGCTSCFVTDNADLIQMRNALVLVRKKVVRLLDVMGRQARTHRALPTLGYTHLQPAQLTTVGKRICMWMQDFLIDLHDLSRMIDELPFRGVKGTTGTQASFLALFSGDHAKVVELDRRVSDKMGFARVLPITGQTYTRKLDFRVLAVLSSIAQSAHKFATDIRLLASTKEIEEPFESHQIGSSAMAYKRNPMRCERICSIARYVTSLLSNATNTACTQWLERTLDDSANRRICIPEAFLGVDAILDVARNVFSGLQVWPLVIEKHVNAELPFMATENILMACVQAGGDRQAVHEAIREHSMAAGCAVKQSGADNDLLERIANDPIFAPAASSLSTIVDPRAFIGRAPEQVDEFLRGHVQPVLDCYTDDLRSAQDVQLRV